jgi:RimJ/RimL family protein N-acetyltransferase
MLRLSNAHNANQSGCALRFSPTRDFELIRRVLTHEKIWDHISDDGAPAVEEFQPADHPAFTYLEVRDGEELLGLFLLVRENAACMEVHTCLLPAAWGPRAREAARGLIDWVFTHTDCRRLITSVPAYNRLALRFAERAGMTKYGENPDSFLKRGRLYSQVLLGISKCQQQP